MKRVQAKTGKGRRRRCVRRYEGRGMDGGGRLVGLAALVGGLVLLRMCPALLGFLPQPAIAQAAKASGLLLLKAKEDALLPEGLVERVQALAHGAQVERYLSLQVQPHEVIGVEPGRPGRLIQGEQVLAAQRERGRWFKAEDHNVVVVGEVSREDYLGGMPGHAMGAPHGGMQHPFEIGATFTLQGSPQRLRVISAFTADPKAAAAKVFLPLASVQKLFGKEGFLSHLVVVVEPAERVEQVKGELAAALGDMVEIIPQR